MQRIVYVALGQLLITCLSDSETTYHFFVAPIFSEIALKKKPSVNVTNATRKKTNKNFLVYHFTSKKSCLRNLTFFLNTFRSELVRSQLEQLITINIFCLFPNKYDTTLRI